MVASCAMPRGGPPYSATDEPPPKGTPAPRVGHIPPPPPNPGADSDEGGLEDQRYLILQGRERKERARRQATPGGQIGVATVPAVVQACAELSAEERIECPLNSGRAVESIVDTPEGVEVTLRRGSAPPERLRHQFECQKSLAASRPEIPAACPFLDVRTEAEVISRDGRVAVELRRSGDVDVLREQVRTALERR